MDFNKIVRSTHDKCIKNIVDGKYRENLFKNSDIPLDGESTQDYILMDFSITLLQNYHEELKKELAKNGIHIDF